MENFLAQASDLIASGASVIAIAALILSAITTPFIREVVYYCKKHPRGTLKFIFTTLLSLALIIPNSLFLILAIVCLALQQTMYRRKKSDQEKNPIIEELGPKTDSKNIVYLIHGTFNENADWVFQKESKMRKGLTDAFKGDVNFLALSWSGENSESARKKASDTLLSSILKYNQKKEKEEKIYIVCHSHGGNIVLNCAKKANGRDFKLVEKIAFLSVPVINIVEREVSPRDFTQYLAGAYILILSIPTFFTFLISPFAACIVLSISFLILLLFDRKARQLIDASHSHIDEEVSIHHEDPRIKSCSKFYICLGDEAHVALEIASSMAALPHRSANRIVKAATIRRESVAATSSSKSLIPWFLCLALSALIGSIALHYTGNANWARSIYILVAFAAGVALTIRPSQSAAQATSEYIGLLSYAMLFFTNTLAALSFGNPKYMCSVKYQIYPSRTPKEEWSIATFDSDYEGMAHSTHSHTAVVDNIANFFIPSKRSKSRSMYKPTKPSRQRSMYKLVAPKHS